jgi:UrcA family protein
MKAHGAVSSRLVCWAAVGVAAMSLFTINAHAGEATPQRTVRYADLDLSKSTDAKALYGRLERASKAVCRSLETREVKRMQLHQACYEEALSNAVASVDHANITALYRADGSIRVAQRGIGSQRRS